MATSLTPQVEQEVGELRVALAQYHRRDTEAKVVEQRLRTERDGLTADLQRLQRNIRELESSVRFPL